MGQAASAPKCNGCAITTPFFGQLYGRMSQNTHGKSGTGVACKSIGKFSEVNSKLQWKEFNKLKNQTLIPFYGTVQAVRVLAAGIMKNPDKLQNLGISYRLAMRTTSDRELKAWFAVRIFVALIPVVGTIINGTLDLIAQVGLQYKNRGRTTITGNVDAI